MSATSRKLQRAHQRGIVLTAVRAQGCRCDITIKHLDAAAAGGRARVEHNPGCHLIGRMGQVVIDLNPPPRCER